MKLIHCADLHLDSSMTTHLTKEKAKENRTKLDELANFLYEKETITGEEFMGILNG